MTRGWLVAAALLASLARPAPALEPVKVQAHALRQLHEQLRTHLMQHGSAAPMPWRDALVLPDEERLVWGPRPLRWNKSRFKYRAALDPQTSWFYVIKTERDGTPQYFGPLEEAADGQFVDWKR
jgi:hypothetical protein